MYCLVQEVSANYLYDVGNTLEYTRCYVIRGKNVKRLA